MRAQNFNFVPKFSPNVVFLSRILYFPMNIFGQEDNLGKGGNYPPPPPATTQLAVGVIGKGLEPVGSAPPALIQTHLLLHCSCSLLRCYCQYLARL